MKLSKEAEILLSLCWKNGQRASTTFIIGDRYTWEGKEFKPTENTYEELERYRENGEKQVKIYRNGNYVNITGGVLEK
ncbi:hypothetical protein [Paenibacillus sp. FSL E2-0178]|uniref:hypothetical protein n=1 Tax=Paenibacillus sp. FSL E2-0178 TaxID=2921361 RepID=UPI0031584CDB